MKILVPATSANLGPGFDCLGLSLKLFNEVVIERANFTSISISGEGSENVFLKKNNAFVRIFNEIYEKLSGKKKIFASFLKIISPFQEGLAALLL